MKGDVNRSRTLLTSGEDDVVYCVAFSPIDCLIAAGLSYGAVRIWAAQTGALVETLSRHMGAVRSVAFARDGEALLSGSSDGTIKIWNIAALVEGAAPHELESVFSPAQSSEGDGRCPCVFTLKGHENEVNSVAVSSIGRWIVSVSDDRTMRFWDRRAGELHCVTEVHGDLGKRYFFIRVPNSLICFGLAAVLSVAFSPLGGLLATGSYDGTAKICMLLIRLVEAVILMFSFREIY